MSNGGLMSYLEENRGYVGSVCDDLINLCPYIA